MAPSFKVPKQAYDAFLDLIEIGDDKLAKLEAEVAKEDWTLDVSVMASRLSVKIECDGERLERAISAVLIPLSSLRATFGMQPEAFMRLLDEMIAKQNREWHEAHHPKWAAVTPQVGQLIAKNSRFSDLRKAFELLANRPALVREFKILTELRPVLDDDATATKAMLLTNTLVIDYEDGESWRRLHLTVNEQDLLDLQRQIDRARAKAVLLQEQSNKFGVPVLVAGAASG
jgi:hypothetical protein